MRAFPASLLAEGTFEGATLLTALAGRIYHVAPQQNATADPSTLFETVQQNASEYARHALYKGENLTEGYIVELRFVLDAPAVYESANAVEFDAEEASFHFRNGRLRVRPHRLENSVKRLRRQIEGVLRGWEFQDTLICGFSPPAFAYVDAEIVGEEASVQLDPPDKLHHDEADVEEILVTVNHFAHPPQVRAAPELIAAWQRWYHAKVGIGESMQSATYFVLTVLERAAGGRREAAKTFAIDLEVLRRMGELSSTTGDLATARKSSGANGALSAGDKQWLHSAVRAVLLNAGQHAAGVTPRPIGLSDIGRSA